MKFIFFIFSCAIVCSSLSAAANPDSLAYVFTNFQDSTKRDPVLSADIDSKTEPGKLLLAKGDLKNLSPGSRFSITYLGTFPPQSGQNADKPDTSLMNPNTLRDNSYITKVSFPPPLNVGSSVKIDLKAIRKVNRIRVANLGANSFSFNTRPIAFSYYAGVDSNRLSRIFQEFANIDSIHTAVINDAQPVQYLSFVIDKQSSVTATVISEIEVYAEGYADIGSYVSKVDSIGNSSLNFATVHLGASIPEGTMISFEMRTGKKKTVDSLSWSSWSDPILFRDSIEAIIGKLMRVSEPRKYFQYRLILSTQNLNTPKISELKFVYQTSLLADSTSAKITPQEIPVLSPVTLTYTITANMSSTSLGIDTIRIMTPSPSTLRSVSVNSTAVPYQWIQSPDNITIAFPSTITTQSTIDIIFSTKLIESGVFPAEIINRASPWNPQTIDPLKTVLGNGWNVVTSGIPKSSLFDVRIDPNPFTPNGDGRNDATVVDFSIANIEKPKPLHICIYDLTGRKIRTLLNIASGVNPYFGDPRKGGKGFLWDGRNDDGAIVRPGVYIIQVSLDVDNGGQFITKSVVVAY